MENELQFTPEEIDLLVVSLSMAAETSEAVAILHDLVKEFYEEAPESQYKLVRQQL